MSQRTEALARALEEGAHALATFASDLTEEQWQTRLPHDGRKVGVVLHHVAIVYPLEIEFACSVAAGTPAGITGDAVNHMNAGHARQYDVITKQDALELLASNSAAAAAAIRSLTDEELDRSAPVALYGNARVTCQFVLEDHAVRHSSHHLARIKAALAPQAEGAEALDWQSVINNSAIGVVLMDTTGRVLATNATYQRMLGYSETELEQISLLEVTHEDYRDHNLTLFTELLDGKRDRYQIEKQYWRKDGSLVWVRNNVSLVPATKNTPRLVLALSEEITERKHTG